MLKIRFFAPVLILILSLFYSCDIDLNLRADDDDMDGIVFLRDSLGIDSCLSADSLSPAMLPATSQAYLSQNYTQDSIVSVNLFSTISDSIYLVELDQGVVVLFDSNGDFIFESDAPSVNPEEFLKSIEQLFGQFYPDFELDEIEYEGKENGSLIFEVEFEDDLEFYLAYSGTDLCFYLEDDEDDEDDED